MAYTIYKSDGTKLISLDDYLVDNSSLSINLIGKNVSSYGTYQNENFLYLLENFSSTVAPNNPLAGQIWFDKQQGIMRPMTFDGGTWRPLSVLLYSNTATDTTMVSGSTVSSQEPGDLWFKSDDEQLYINTGSAYKLIGPELVPGFGTTKMSSTSMTDIYGVTHPVIQMILDNEVVGVVSNVTFASTATNNPLQLSFPTVYRGVTFANYSLNNRYSTAPTDVVLHGLHEQLDISYPRRGVDEHIQGNWIFDSDVMLQFGTQANTKIQYIGGSNNLLITNPNGLLTLSANGAGIYMDGNSLSPQVLNSFDLGLTGQQYRTVYARNLNSGSPFVTGNLVGAWALSNNSTLVPNADAGNNLGTSSLRFNNVYTFGLNSGADQGIIKGSWQLDANLPFVPLTDGINNLGSVSKKFANMYTIGISSGDAFNPLAVQGQITLDGSLYPSVDQTYNIGSNAARYNTVYASNLDSNVVRTGDLSATINTLLDSFANSITRFDRDTQFTADSDSRLPTQHAVKAYVDQLGASLITALNALQTQVNNLQFVPAGAVSYTAGSIAPTGYLVANGTLINTADYPALFAAIGYTYGGGGSQFQLPDLRGQFIRGWDANRGLDAGRQFGTAQGSDIGPHRHEINDVYMVSSDQAGPFNLDGSNGSPARDINGSPVDYGEYAGGTSVIARQDNAGDGGVNDNGIWTVRNRTESAGGAETRPTNVALLPIIKI
jgi:microcystin-dependent protein